jgi:type I restriction-modification system DNA methylase subunit
MTTKEEARTKVAELVARALPLTPAQVQHTNEEATKQGYILPLVHALGWNPEDLSEVSPEERASNGRVDYAFKLQGVSRFYLEAKALGVDITEERWARQAITYAMHQGVTWAVLCNFRHLMVFNANMGGATPQTVLVLNLTAEEYVSDFDRLWLLSKEAIENRQLEEQARKDGRLPERVPIEKRLYAQLREWREHLWNETAQYKEDLHPEQIDEIIQRFFNRLIFIRTCEDRGLEEHRLRGLLAQYRDRQLRGRQPLLGAVRQVFDEYRQGYDSELFEEHMLDEAHIDEPTLAEVLDGLHRVHGSLADYDFSLITADVLGAVYEQYLGHIAQRAKQRQQALQARLDLGLPQAATYEVVEKRQRRKEQGIYYTPQWVVDYIVGQTVGRFIQEHKNRPDAIAEMKVLDMACGSGSFLIRAYDALLRWEAELAGMPVAQLTQEYRMPVLRRNIFGVDLDQQAVEIARLNLLLRALAARELLPPLRDNVRRGNSLVSAGEPEKHPLDWEREFPEIMGHGGFDVVIGNPPYVRIQTLPRDEADYYRRNYESAFGSFDIYVMFIERGLGLLKPGGRLGFITSGKFLKAEYGKKLQQHIRREATVEEIVDLSAQEVFADATTYPVMLVLRKGSRERKLRYTFVPGGAAPGAHGVLGQLAAVDVEQNALQVGVWPPPTGSAKVLMAKVDSRSVQLGRLASNVFQGLITSADKIYTLEVRSTASDGIVRVFSRALGRELELEQAPLKPLLTGKGVYRYTVDQPKNLLLFPYWVSVGRATLISPEALAEEYPKCWAYLTENRKALEDREGGKMRHERWYAFGRTQSLGLHDFPKLAIPHIVYRLESFYDAQGRYYLDNVDVGGLILRDAADASYKYVMAMLNSRLLDWYFRQASSPFRGGYRAANRQYIEKLPIRVLDLGKPEEKRRHDRIVGQVEEMLALQERLGPLRGIPSEARAELERRIAQVDRAIDEAVYALYGLTDAERRLVEGEI